MPPSLFQGSNIASTSKFDGRGMGEGGREEVERGGYSFGGLRFLLGPSSFKSKISLR